MPPAPPVTPPMPPSVRAGGRQAPSRGSRAPGFTVVELAVTLGIAAILVAFALPAIDFNRFRMDSSARLVQNQLLWAQSRAVQRNMQVLVELDNDRGQLRIVDDSTASGAWETGETQVYRSLGEGMQFVTPPTTIDGATPNYATGTGVSVVNGTHPQLIFYPNGSTSGDAVIYLGSPRARLQDNRAIKVTGSTSKMYFYRMGSDGIWRLSDL